MSLLQPEAGGARGPRGWVGGQGAASDGPGQRPQPSWRDSVCARRDLEGVWSPIRRREGKQAQRGEAGPEATQQASVRVRQQPVLPPRRVLSCVGKRHPGPQGGRAADPGWDCFRVWNRPPEGAASPHSPERKGCVCGGPGRGWGWGACVATGVGRGSSWAPSVSRGRRGPPDLDPVHLQHRRAPAPCLAQKPTSRSS